MRRNLVRDSEIRRVVELARDLGLSVGALDVRFDGMTIHTAPPTPENEFDRWMAQDKARQAKAEAARANKR